MLLKLQKLIGATLYFVLNMRIPEIINRNEVGIFRKVFNQYIIKQITKKKPSQVPFLL